jgi:hypothetical protein
MMKPDKRQRVLWIAYAFPPVGGTQGVRMQRYLQEIVKDDPGLAIDVLTIRQTAANPQFDEGLSRGIPDGIQVHRVQPGALHKLRHRLGLDRRSLAESSRAITAACLGLIHLSNLGWIPHAMAWLVRRRLMARHPYDAVYVFVDPFASLALGLFAAMLNQKARLILEYGDPRIPVRMPSSFRRPGEFVEQRALGRCDKAIFRTLNAVKVYQEYYPVIPHERFTVLYGGVDWEAYDAISSNAANSADFLIAYTGTIYADSVDPAPFFHALARIGARKAEVGRVKVRMVGAPSPVVTRLVETLGLSSLVSFTDHVPVTQVVSIQRSAVCLLAFGVKQPYKISSKIAQYIAARVPIIYISDAAEDPGADLVVQSRRGFLVQNDVDAIMSALLDAHQAWQRGDLRRRFDLSRTEMFSWHQVGREVGCLLAGARKDGQE